MTWFSIIVAVISVTAVWVAYAIGVARGREEGATKAVNVVLATLAVTGELTYGLDFTNDFMAEMVRVSKLEHESIRALAQAADTGKPLNLNGLFQ